MKEYQYVSEKLLFASFCNRVSKFTATLGRATSTRKICIEDVRTIGQTAF